MIKLKDKKWLAQGANRVCYIHPDDPDKVLKIIKPWKMAKVKKHQAPWYKKLRSAVCFDDNVQELKALQWLEKKEHACHHFPRCFGLEETDLGDALCLEYVHSGRKAGESLSLEQYLKKNGFTDEISKALDDLCVFLYQNLIVTRDLRVFNIMVRYTDNGIVLVIVDGLGNPEFIPISNVIPKLGRLKIQRKLFRFKKRLERIDRNKTWNVPVFS